MDRVALHRAIDTHFSLDELRTLCFDLHIDFDNLGGEGKQGKARELALHCERTGKIPELLEAIRRLRPDLDLPVGSRIGPVPQPSQVAEQTVDEAVVARPVNLSFEAFTIGDWPSGWFKSARFVDGVSTAYEARVVARPDEGKGRCVMFWNPRATPTEFGSLMQRCPARHLAGKAIRLEADIKTWQVERWTGLWLRADGDDIPNLVFDNMSERPIRGSTAWARYAIDVQLPNETTWLNYGIVLAGQGTVWADNFRLTVWTDSGKWVDV
jgi:hypothetical protein